MRERELPHFHWLQWKTYFNLKFWLNPIANSISVIVIGKFPNIMINVKCQMKQEMLLPMHKKLYNVNLMFSNTYLFYI